MKQVVSKEHGDLNYQELNQYSNTSQYISDTKEYINKNLANLSKEIESAQSRENIVVIGDSGEGKSSLINILIGNKDINYVIKTRKSTIEYEEGLNGPKIGSGESVTSTIKPWQSYGNITYWDCPGFADTRDPNNTDHILHDIANVKFIDQFMSSGVSMKILFVVSDLTIFDDRNTKFKNIVKNIANYFTNLNDLKKAMVLVITKVDYNKSVKEYKEEIKEYITYKFEDKKAQELFDFLISPESKLGFFRKVKDKEQSEQDKALIHDILLQVNTMSKPQTDFKSILSEKSLGKLPDMAQDMNDLIYNECNFIKGDIIKYINNLLYNAVRSIDIKDLLKTSIKKEIDLLSKTDDTPSFLKQLKNILDINTIKYNVDEHLKYLVDFISFLKDFSKKTVQHHIPEWYNGIMKITQLVDKLTDVKVEKIKKNSEQTVTGLIIKAPLFGISELKDEYKKQDSIKDCTVLSHAFYSDDDLTAHGLNLAILTNYWIAKEEHTINLSGRDGIDGLDADSF